MSEKLTNLSDALEAHLPAEVLTEVKRVLFGNPTVTLEVAGEAQALSSSKDFEIKSFGFPCAKEQVRSPRLVRVGLIQNQIVLPTTAPILEQINALHKRIGEMIDAAVLQGANIICMQEAWSLIKDVNC